MDEPKSLIEPILDPFWTFTGPIFCGILKLRKSGGDSLMIYTALDEKSGAFIYPQE